MTSVTTGEPTGRAAVAADPGVLQANLRAIEAHQPEVAAAIAAAAPAPEAVFFLASDGAVSAEVGGRLLASRRRPLEEAGRLAESVELEQTGAVVALGFALGHHLGALAQRARGTTALIVFEPDAGLLRAALERVDHSAWLASTPVRFVLTDAGAGEITAALRGLEGALAVGPPRFLEHPPSRGRLEEASRAFRPLFVKAFEAVRTHIVTTMMQADVTARNELMNVGAYTRWPGIAELRDVYAGRPAILVAAGPSLRRNIHLLETPGLRDRCLIVCVQTVLRQLLERGIRPHFATAIDYHEISKRFYEGLTPELVAGTTLIAEARANPTILDTYPGDVRMPRDEFLTRVLGWEDRPDRGTVPPAATVAHLSYYLARFLGADPVIMVGQDLAFTDGQYYARGAAIHDVWASELGPFGSLERMEWERIVRWRGHLHEAQDHLGRRVYTDDQMATYLAQFERDFAPDLAAGRTVIDATEGGVAKRGATIMTLADAIDRYAPPGADPIPAPPRPEVAGDESAAVRERLRSIRRDVRRVGRGSREGRELLRKMMADQRNIPRVNRLVDEINQIRDEVQALDPAFELVLRLNQLGALKRFRADRRITLAEGADELEVQRRRIERDEENLRWTGELADVLDHLLEVADATFDGGPKLTREIAFGSIDDEGGEADTETPVRAAACIVLPGIDLEGARPALAGALSRLRACERLDSVVIATDDPAGVGELVGSLGLAEPPEVVEAPIDVGRLEGIRAARAFAPMSWRGGIGGLTVFDEVLDPAAALAAIDRVGADAAVVLGAGWSELDASLTDRLIERHAERPESNPIVFAQTPPGVTPCVLGRSLLRELAETPVEGAWLASIGSALGYLPVRPRTDPIAKDGCVQIEASVRDAAAPTTSDGPAHLTVELTTRRRGRGSRFPFAAPETSREDLTLERAASLFEQAVRLAPEVCVTLAGYGDPLEHPGWSSVVRAARDAGVRHVHLRTDLLCDEATVGELEGAGIDVVSVDALAHQRETYARLTGMDAHATMSANLDSLVRARRERGAFTTPWIVPRITRRDAVYDELEVFYDKWILLAHAAAIDPLPAPVPGERIEPLGRPRTTIRRDAATRLTVLCDGSVVCGDLDLEGRDAVGRIDEEPLGELWRRAVARRSAAIERGELDHPDLAVIW